MGVKQAVKAVVKKVADAMNFSNSTNTGRYFDMSTVEARQQTVQEDYGFAKSAKTEQVIKMQKYDNYYNGKHVASLEISKALEEDGIPFIPAIVPDPYIHVESQIIPGVPDFEFRGRDNDQDSVKAKEREYAARFVLDNNKIESMNTENERRVNKLGNAFWKVSWDANKTSMSKDGRPILGEIIIGNPDPANIFPDPSAIDIQSCEFFAFAYRIHRRAVARQFAKQLKELGMTMNDIGDDGKQSDTQIYEGQQRDLFDDSVQIVEYWFKQDTYGSGSYDYTGEDGVTKSMKYEWEPGDIACSIQISNKEIQYIPKYWIKTGKQCKLYPFVKYCKIAVENSFWDKSDLESIIPLTDQCDRELAIAILNDAFMANDIILEEDGAIVDGCPAENKPGARWKTAQGKVNSVKRLGGVANSATQWQMIDKLRDIIKQTVGNFDVNMGDAPPNNVKTLGGIVELKEQGNKRQNIKKADRTMGFEQLLELIDWHVLEFYDDNRMIFIGAKTENEKPKVVEAFNSENHNTGTPEEPYFPRVDTVISAGDGIEHSPSMTLMATENLLSKPITPQNYKLIASMIDLMQLPNRKELKEWLDNTFGQPPPSPTDKPNITIAYKDIGLPPTPEQAQILALAGIKAQPTQQQGQPQQPQLDPNMILDQLSPEERQHLSANPHLLDTTLQKLQGGGGNAGMPQV